MNEWSRVSEEGDCCPNRYLRNTMYLHNIILLLILSRPEAFKSSERESPCLRVRWKLRQTPHISSEYHTGGRAVRNYFHVLDFFNASTLISGSPHIFFSSSCQVSKSKTALGTLRNKPRRKASIYQMRKTYYQ